MMPVYQIWDYFLSSLLFVSILVISGLGMLFLQWLWQEMGIRNLKHQAKEKSIKGKMGVDNYNRR